MADDLPRPIGLPAGRAIDLLGTAADRRHGGVFATITAIDLIGVGRHHAVGAAGVRVVPHDRAIVRRIFQGLPGAGIVGPIKTAADRAPDQHTKQRAADSRDHTPAALADLRPDHGAADTAD